MKKYLAEFETEQAYSEFLHSADYVTPNVSLVTALGSIIYTKGVIGQGGITINGELATDKVITLAAGGTYELSGVHEGQIIIDANSVKPDEWTTIILNGVTILSDEAYGILYNCPQSNNKGYQGLNVILEKDSHNFIVCNKETTVEDDKTYASIDSWKDLSVKGVGYLAVYNNIGHGLRGENMNVAGPHLYVDTDHDGIHGKTVNIFDGVFYFANAKDGFGTTDTGKINVFGGTFDFTGVTQDRFDSNEYGYYVKPGISGNNMKHIETMYEAGTVKAWATAADYKADKNKVNYTLIEPTTQPMKEIVLYNADANGNVVASQAPAGYTVPVVSTDSTTGEEVILIPEQSMYVIGSEYEVVEVTGKITVPIVRPMDAITIDAATFSKKGKLNGGYDNNFDVYLNGAVIVTSGDAPSIVNLPDTGRMKVVAVKDTINAVINKYNGEGTADHDAIKSENNLPIEVKSEAILYVTSILGDGVDGGETTFTDSKGSFIVSGCGERGVKGNAVVIGPSAQIDASVITSYITDTTSDEYTTFDGIFIAKGNVTKEGNVVGNADISSEEAAKSSGYADVYGRNGKCSKGVFGTTDAELKGIAIIGSLTAYQNVDTGNAKNLHVNQILRAAANPIETVQEAYIAVPYEGDPIV